MSERVSASMAEVLRQVNKDHGHVHTYRGGAQGCRCGQRDPNSIGTNSWIWGHVAQVGAEQLAANGYGKLEDAWDEGLSAGQDRWLDSREFGDPPVNPYRRPE